MEDTFRLIEDIKYFFDKNGIEVYINDEAKGEFLLALQKCTACSTPWNLEITQCFLCGAINPFLKRDRNGIWKSITGSKGEGEYACINKDCPSNKNKEIKKLIKKHYGSVFLRGSIFNTSLENCIKCGNDEYNYTVIPLYVIVSEKLDKEEILKWIDNRLDIKFGIGPVLIIFRNDKELAYFYVKTGGNIVDYIKNSQKGTDINNILKEFN